MNDSQKFKAGFETRFHCQYWSQTARVTKLSFDGEKATWFRYSTSITNNFFDKGKASFVKSYYMSKHKNEMHG